MLSATSLTVDSYTSRVNPLPTNSVVLEVKAGRECRLALAISGQHPKGGPFQVSCKVGMDALDGNDTSLSISDSFSAPRVRIGPALNKGKLCLAAEFVDSEPGEKDFYFVKVVQKNGHLAWSSPIWCR